MWLVKIIVKCWKINLKQLSNLINSIRKMKKPTKLMNDKDFEEFEKKINMNKITETKAKQIAREFLNEFLSNGRSFELWRRTAITVDGKLINTTTNDGRTIAFLMIPPIFLGNGNIVVSTDQQEAIEVMKKVEHGSDQSLFEIDQYKEIYTVVWN